MLGYTLTAFLSKVKCRMSNVECQMSNVNINQNKTRTVIMRLIHIYIHGFLDIAPSTLHRGP